MAIFLLFVVYTFHSIDRNILSILAQPIKEDLKLADWQLGLLTGFAFSTLYVIAGVPMARLADRGNRIKLVSICAMIWSGMTMLCGVSANFVQLCLARMCVGIGESGYLPASHSLISDYYPPSLRAKALALFGMGLPIGGLIGMMIGGFAVDNWGWRAAFFVVGLPGVIVALIAWLVLKEPVRGRYDAKAATEGPPSAVKLPQVASALWRSPVARNVVIALTLASFFGSASSGFMGAYLARKFELGYTEIGTIMAIAFMAGTAISTLGGGLLADWAGRRDQRWYLWIPGIGVAIGIPFLIAAYSATTWQGFAGCLFMASVAGAAFYAPSYAVIHNAIGPRSRAMTTVIVQGTITLLGYSLGPLIAGLSMDITATQIFQNQGFVDFLATCPGGRAKPGAGLELVGACKESLLTATQLVIIVFALMRLWPVAHFFMAARRLPKGPAGA